MRMCTSRAPAARSMVTILRLVVPRTIESSTTTTRLPSSTSRCALSFTFTPKWRIGVLRLDERAADVVIADQPEVERQPGLLGVAERGRHAGVGHRDDEVGRRPAARAPAGGRAPCAPGRRCGRTRCCRGARSRRTRRRSACAARGGNGKKLRTPSADATTTSPGSTSRTYSAPIRSSAQVSDATTTRPCPRCGRAPAGGSRSDRARRSARSGSRNSSE